MLRSSSLKNNALVILFFLGVLILSLYVYRDYGVSVDERVQSQHLRVTGKKILWFMGVSEQAPNRIRQSPDVDKYVYRYYGLAAQYPLLFLEFFSGTFSSDGPLFWQFRHLYTRIVFVTAGVFLYLILRKITPSKLLIFLGLLLFFAHPRIHAHSFYNIKDNIFLSFFVISMYFLYRAIELPSKKNLLLFSFFSALLVNIRMMGLLIPAFFIFYMFWACSGGLNNKKFSLNSFKRVGLYLSGFFSFLFMIWPLMWVTPIDATFMAFGLFSNYTAWDKFVLFGGQMIRGRELPFYYIPVSLAVTTPWVHLIVWSLGLALLLLFIFKKVRRKSQYSYIFISSWFFIFGTYFSVLALGSTLYNGWRHVQYIFGPLVICGVYALDYIRSSLSKKRFIILTGVLFFLLIQPFFWSVRYHPYQYVYFNQVLAGENRSENWERDYWGVSGTDLLKWLLENGDPSIPMTICCPSYDITGKNLPMLSVSERKNISLVGCLDNIANYRFFYYNAFAGKAEFDGYEELHSIIVDGEKISTIFIREDLIAAD